MKNRNLLVVLMALTFGFSALNATAEKDPMVGGAAMYPTKNIVANAVNSNDHTTLVVAVKAAGLVEHPRRPWTTLRSLLPPTKPSRNCPRGRWTPC